MKKIYLDPTSVAHLRRAHGLNLTDHTLPNGSVRELPDEVFARVEAAVVRDSGLEVNEE